MKAKQLLLAFFATFFLSTPSWAEVYSGTCGDNGDNVTWTLDTSTGLLRIEGTGAIRDYDSNSPWFDRRSAIVNVEIADGVTRIGANAFQWSTGLTSVTIPESVTSIGSMAFWNCSDLSLVNMGDGVTIIEEGAFGGCLSLPAIDNIRYIGNWVVDVADNSLSTYNIKGGIRGICDSAFRGCSSLTSISIPEGVTSIGNSVFFHCSRLISVTIPESVTSIGDDAFYYCSGLTSITIPNSVTSIGDRAFQNCSGLTSITIPNSVTSIRDDAFKYCYGLTSVYITDLEAWCNISFFNSYSNPLKYATHLYVGGEEIKDIIIPNSVENIKFYAFNGCTCLNSVTIPDHVTNVSSNAFNEGTVAVIVPDDKLEYYQTVCSNSADRIYPAGQYEREVSVTAKSDESDLHKKIGEENLRNVGKLKVKGSINGYDIMIIRNKMIRLLHLDLSEATIEGNDYQYYTGYHTTDNEIGPYAFYGLSNLVSVKLPVVTAVQKYAFASCGKLKEINLPESLTTLATYAFQNCKALEKISIPGSVQAIGSYAFDGCNKLNIVSLNEGLERIDSYAFRGCRISEIRFPESLTTIGDYAFSSNYNILRELNLPPNLNTIGKYAFQSCQTEVVRLNPMLKNISNYAFSGCNALKKVYTYTLEPTDIQQNTYSTYQTADLYVPTPSYYTYYYNTQWSQFLSVNKTDEEYDFKSFYINKDYEMNDDSGILGGEPDAELNENSGLINSGSETQELGTVTIRFNGNNGSASIIANGNLTAEKIKVEITVTGNKWHFFCFPFDVPLSGVSVSGGKAYVFRHYNAEKRAAGESGWENLPDDQDYLTAGEGYIFQANGNTTLTVTVDNKTTFVGENVATALHVQDAANVANASWNFKGNRGYAYFDIDDLGFSAPITVWDPNTNNYVALRPGDDDAFLHPFQAFFVQKPEGTDNVTFNAEDRTTYLGSQKKLARKIEARRRAAANIADNPRKLVNLTVSDGISTDKTRVVFNDEKSMEYEMDCDAAKFATANALQLYSIDTNNTHYAINERPNDDGTVRLGFTADKAGNYTIEAVRMDTPCYLRDLMTGNTHDLRYGSYDFESEKGTFENRFQLVNAKVADGTDGVESIELGNVANDAVIYDLQGRLQKRAQRGVFIINGKKVTVK